MKRLPVAAHLDTILRYGNSCIDEEESEPVQERQLKRYKKNDTDTVEALKYQLHLERELRDLQQQINARRVAALETELKTLKEQQQHTRPARETPVRRTAKPKKVSPKKAGQQQQGIDQFMVPINTNQPVLTVAPSTNAIVLSQEAERAKAEEAERAAIARAAWDTQVESSLVSYSENGVNIGIFLDTQVRLSAYLEKFLDATAVPQANQFIREVVDHPLLTNYRVSMMTNMSIYETHSDQEYAQLYHLQKREVLDRTSERVRYNISNTMIHTWFLHKAIELSNTSTMSHKPIILNNFEHRYSDDIRRKWYPFIDSGNGFIITPDLKITAVANLQGQGHGKHCCYCNLQYIACRNGVLKHAHQVKNCDYIANLSNDERVVITTLLNKCGSCTEFANHEFIAKRNAKSLFRLATPEEERSGRFVLYGRERLRLNMPIFLAMRARSYKDFTDRIASLDTHKPEMNLNAKPFAYQIDCFNLNAPLSKRKNKNVNVPNSGKLQKEDGFLYKSLLDFDGKQFRKSKFTADGKQTLRDFKTLNADGFADDMFFSEPVVYTHEELTQQVNARLLENSRLLALEAAPRVIEVYADEENLFAVNDQSIVVVEEGEPLNEYAQFCQKQTELDLFTNGDEPVSFASYEYQLEGGIYPQNIYSTY